MGTLIYAVDQERNQGGIVNDIVIPRNTKLPCSITKDYRVMHDGQKTVKCSVTQSEGEESDVEFVYIIKEEELKLSKNAKEGDPVEVTYSYDTNSVMHCIFKEMKSKNTHEMELKPEGSKDLKELKENLDFDIE
jgi:molecular chaperone DnaK